MCLLLKEDSLSLKITKLNQELIMNFKIKNKNYLVLFTQKLLLKHKFLIISHLYY